MNNSKITVVVSRYNEDINWLKKIYNNEMIEKIIILNKGPRNIRYLSLENKKVDIRLKKNIGREGGSYLDFIINNYDNLPENIIFTQADPFEHNESFLDFFTDENIPLYINNDMVTLTKQWKVSRNIPPKHYVKYNNCYNIEHLELIKYFVSDYDQQVIGHSYFFDKHVLDKYNIFLNKYPKEKNITQYMCKLIGIPIPKRIIPITWSACFFVKSKQIKKHPKEVYIKLRKFLYHSHPQGSIQGYFIERFWYYLFTGESYNTIDECLKELFIDIEPIIKIYCTKKKQTWFKSITKCTVLIQNTSCYIIYIKNGIQKILPGLYYEGDHFALKNCNTLDEALQVNV